jgi:superoxide dismutase, Fe-Mn family
MYKEIDFTPILGTPGFSDELLKAHFKLYAGYVKNTNLLQEKLAAFLQDGKQTTPEFAELKRRFGWEFNGMRLHELYFSGLHNEKTTLPEDSPLFKKMVESFGSGKNCHEDFIATGSMRGIGWVILAYDPLGGKLFNVWINEHDVGHLAGAVPIVVMDVFEHAFIKDYGMDRAAYIKSFIDAIDWNEAQARFGMVKSSGGGCGSGNCGCGSKEKKGGCGEGCGCK